MLIYSCYIYYRVVWVFGKSVSYPVFDVTPTHLSQGVLATLREADYVAHSILKYNGEQYSLVLFHCV